MALSGMGRDIVRSRQLVAQSKRLRLVCVHRRRGKSGGDDGRRLIERLEADLARADLFYRAAVLRYTSPSSPEYWIVAYGWLLAMGETLTDAMRSTAKALPPGAKYEVAGEIEALDLILARWNGAMKRSMAEAVA